MMRKSLAVASVLLLVSVIVASPGWCQGGPPPAGVQGGFGGPGAMMGGRMAQVAMPTPVMLVADGVLYIACDGKVVAFEAKTLRKLAEATYWEPQMRPQRAGRTGQGTPGAGVTTPATPPAVPAN